MIFFFIILSTSVASSIGKNDTNITENEYKDKYEYIYFFRIDNSISANLCYFSNMHNVRDNTYTKRISK